MIFWGHMCFFYMYPAHVNFRLALVAKPQQFEVPL